MSLPRRSFLKLASALLASPWAPRLSFADDDVPPMGARIVLDLMDEKNRFVSTDDLTGKWLLAFFGYTSCPDICPTALFEIAEALKSLDGAGRKIQPIFISLDPERDEPRWLREYVDSFDSRFLPLTGTSEQIRRSAKSFGVSYFKVPGSAPGEYTIAHSSFISVVGPEGGLVARYSTDRTVDQIASQLGRLLSSA